MTMDLARDPAILRCKKIPRAVVAAVGAIVLVAISVAVSPLRPAAPLVPAPWIEPVKRGQMTRNVHGSGTLVPQDIRWITSTTSGRVERLVLQPGAMVRPDSVILELSNPDLQQNARSGELAWKSAIAQFDNAKASLRGSRLTQQNAVKNADSQFSLAQAQLDANKQLDDQGLISHLTVKQLLAAVDTASNNLLLSKEQLQIAIENEASQLAPQQAAVNEAKANYENFQRQLKAGMPGVLRPPAGRSEWTSRWRRRCIRATDRISASTAPSSSNSSTTSSIVAAGVRSGEFDDYGFQIDRRRHPSHPHPG